MEFIGRKEELEDLKSLKERKKSSLVIIKGRRRIGKSRLVKEFYEKNKSKYKFYSFAGNAPSPSTTSEDQKLFFALQLKKYFNVPLKHDHWYEMLWFLSEQTKNENAIILFDEISWMGSKDPEFPSTLKTVWDQGFHQNPNMMVVICGSVSSWIDKNIILDKRFVGRISLTLTLKELSLKESSLFWGAQNHKVSPQEKLKVLSVTGGIPRYLEEIDPRLSAEDNIKKLCFTSSGILYQEFEIIFSDLFSKKSAKYKEIVLALANGPLERQELIERLKIPANGAFSDYLEDLITSGFLQQDVSWSFNKNISSRLGVYRLSDNYVRFYLKYIAPNKDKIEKGFFKDVHLSNFPGWYTIMGLQIENLILNNRTEILDKMGVSTDVVANDGPYIQHKTKRFPGCQIDYLVQTKLNEIYVVEVKFYNKELGMSVVSEVNEKIKRLVCPKNFSVRSVLIHVNGVTPAVEESHEFTKIIDLSEMV
jgi:hypothetical protein